MAIKKPRKFRGKPFIIASVEEAYAKQIEMGMKHLYRPNVPGDRYETKEAVEAWARAHVDAEVARGRFVVGAK